MSENQPSDNGGRRGGDRLNLVVALSACTAFALIAMQPEDAAHAGVPVDAVRAAAEAVRGDAGAGAGAETSAGVAAGAATAEPASLRGTPATRFREMSGAEARALLAQGVDGGVREIQREGGATLQFMVKFDEARAADWGRRFQDDPDGARAAFAALARGNGPFRGLKLARMNPYSGVATLELEGSAPATAAEAQALSDEIVRRLSAAEGVEYAEPNFVGQR